MSRRETSPAVPGHIVERATMTTESLEQSLGRLDLDAMMAEISGYLAPTRVAGFITEEAARREQIAALAADFAAEKKYKPLLEWMLDISLRRPIAPWGLTGEAREAYIQRREGANAHVWQLLQAIVEGGGERLAAREASEV